MTSAEELQRQFGQIDIYLFDQLLRGRIAPTHRILDAGCGDGRNLVYLIRKGFDVRAIDRNPRSIESLRKTAAELAPSLAVERFTVQPVERMSFADGEMDIVVSSAVLHFARDEADWWEMVREMWRVLAPGGMFFARLASTIGHESRVQPLGNRRYILPDGSERFLVDEDFLMTATSELGGQLMDPIKTTVVQAMRSMTTWVVRKGGSGAS
jgi:SAM-dependent methyltransferase